MFEIFILPHVAFIYFFNTEKHRGVSQIEVSNYLN